MEKKEIAKRFEARGLSVEIKLSGVVEEEVAHLYNLLVREITRFMNHEVMGRVSQELVAKLKNK